MNLIDQTKYLIKKTGLKPDKLKGQNFCVDSGIIQEMVKTAQVSKKDTVLEVGPGFGFLTTELVKRAGKVIAVELDRKLVKVLRQLEKASDNLEVVEGDILKIKDLKIKRLKDYKIVANLPYSITSAFLKKFLTSENKPKSMTLLIQKEVAERICAKPGQMSLLSISVQLYSQPKIIKIVSSKSFEPVPKVESAILQIDRISEFPYKSQVLEKEFWQVIRAGFCSKRKTLENNLASSFHQSKEEIREILKKCGLKPMVRAQELSISNWVKLAGKFSLTKQSDS